MPDLGSLCSPAPATSSNREPNSKKFLFDKTSNKMVEFGGNINNLPSNLVVLEVDFTQKSLKVVDTQSNTPHIRHGPPSKPDHERDPFVVDDAPQTYRPKPPRAIARKPRNRRWGREAQIELPESSSNITDRVPRSTKSAGQVKSPLSKSK